jgi:hypothetical protein
MARPFKWPEGSYETLEPLLKSVTTPGDMRRLLCVWLSVSLNLTNNEIARAIGLTPPSVRRIQRRFLLEGVSYFKIRPRGGRRRANLTLDDERDLLRPFVFRAERGVKVNFSALRGAYERRVKHEVPKSTIYRMLVRHQASSLFRRVR